MVLKRLPDTLNSIFDFFEKSDFFFDFFWFFWLFFRNLLKSRYPFLDLPTPFWIFLPLFGSSYPFLRKGGKSRKSIFWDEEFFGMSSYSCENFQDDIPNIFDFYNMGLKLVLNFKKQQNPIFGTRSSSGWVLIHLGRTTTLFQNFSIYIIYLKNGYFMNNSSISDFFHFWPNLVNFFQWYNILKR